MGAPLPGAVAALDALYDKRYKLIIHTTKATTDSGKQAVEEWLDYYGCEYHEVTATKPNASYYIDDRAIKHTSWAETLDELGVSDDL
jgi:phosphoglycolate phosphatase-like HAD superfamily hydrolase